MQMKKISLFTMLILTTFTALISIQAQESDEVIDLVFVHHLSADLIEQDVYIMNDENKVERFDNSAPLSLLWQPLYSSADFHAHDPFGLDESSMAAFEVGDELGFTVSEWLSASATGTYTVRDDSAEISITASGLVPDGLYTMWCSRLNPPPEFEINNYPCGAADGTENIFTADSEGTATVEMMIETFEPSLADDIALVALAYHSDGQTYGESPGDFGRVTHTQLFALIPPSE